MGRQHNTDSSMHSSSIALLQERFRQLQRVKEMREERELLRLFSESSSSSSSSQQQQQVLRYQPSNKLFFHPELIIPSTPTPPTCSLPYRRPESQTKYHQAVVVDSPLLMSLWPPADRSNNACKPATIDPTAAEVDTSLHL